MVEKNVLVSEASKKLVAIPAKYGSESKEILVRPSKIIWKTSLDKRGAQASDCLLNAAQKNGIDLAAAKPGDCFHEHFLPPVYETVYEDELVAEESYKIKAIPAQYKMVEEKVLVSEAYNELMIVPATYKWVEEKMLIKEAHIVWKKGRGLIQRVDNTTGEIMCLVNVPAEYKIVKKKVVDKSATTVTKTIPAVYKTVKVRKLVASASEKKTTIPAKYKKIERQKEVQAGRLVWHEIHNLEHPKSTRTGNKICLVEMPAEYRKAAKTVVVEKAKTFVEEIPAKYETVKIKTLAAEAQVRKIDIPAEYQTVSKETKVSEGVLEWRQVLCETNTTPDVISKLQSALIAKGYNPGPVDGAYGFKTESAVKQFQKDNGLSIGALTYETLKRLGF
ncbi:MAG: peptidoglycan-binding protein [Deltaproteobacteria bacterium]|nr:peptidoglycan-binding protein [Candidatus Desulfobacula maris]MBL6992910.1 peptidoglycan-binding protein [Desulfobacula sp.]